MRRSFLSLLILSLAACGADRAEFRPTTGATAESPGGQPAAAYDVRTGRDRDPHVNVHVWSRGAYAEDDRTFVRMAVEVRNTGTSPVTLEQGALRLEAFDNEGRPLPLPQLARTMAPGGSLTVPPGETGTIQLEFAMPGVQDPDSIGQLRLRWGLYHDDGRRYVQFTDFRRVPEYRYVATGITYYDPIYGFYDPFIYGPPWGYYHYRYPTPVRRIIIEHRNRGPVTARRR